MSKNPRLMLTLTSPQREYLEAEAERLGVTIAELIRRIIDKHRKA